MEGSAWADQARLLPSQPPVSPPPTHPVSFGESVKHSSSTSSAAAKAEFSVGPPSHRTCLRPRSPSALRADARSTAPPPVPLLSTSATPAALAKASGRVSSAVITIGLGPSPVNRPRPPVQCARPRHHRYRRQGGLPPLLAESPGLPEVASPARNARARTVPAPTRTTSASDRRTENSNLSPGPPRLPARPENATAPSRVETMLTRKKGRWGGPGRPGSRARTG